MRRAAMLLIADKRHHFARHSSSPQRIDLRMDN